MRKITKIPPPKYKVTFDTNIYPINDLIPLLKEKNISYTRISVTDREMEGCSLHNCLDNKKTEETGVWGESRWGECKWGPITYETATIGESRVGECVLGRDNAVDVFETALKIVSSGTFPKRGKRDNLTRGQRNQLRDAMILATHIREKGDIFVTNDRKGFVNYGKREKIKDIFNTRIMTRDEFKVFLDNV